MLSVVRTLRLKSTTDSLSHACHGSSGLIVLGCVSDSFSEQAKHLRLADDELSSFVHEFQPGPRRVTDLELTDDTIGMSVGFGQTV
jgi:hypothetical protein